MTSRVHTILPAHPSRERIVEILDGIADPCATNAGVNIGIVSMGLVHDLTLTSGETGTSVSLGVTVTEPTCVMYHYFATEADRRLRAEPGINDVSVTVLPYRMWTEDNLSLDAKERLRAVRATREVALPLPSRKPLGLALRRGSGCS
jgi:metal-sulfur cluster biosynthetic enzyme